MPRPKSRNPRNSVANFRLAVNEYAEMEEAARREGFNSLSDYLRHLHATSQKREAKDSQVSETGLFYGRLDPTLFEETGHGKIYLGDSLGLLRKSCSRAPLT